MCEGRQLRTILKGDGYISFSIRVGRVIASLRVWITLYWRPPPLSGPASEGGGRNTSEVREVSEL